MTYLPETVTRNWKFCF